MCVVCHNLLICFDRASVTFLHKNITCGLKLRSFLKISGGSGRGGKETMPPTHKDPIKDDHQRRSHRFHVRIGGGLGMVMKTSLLLDIISDTVLMVLMVLLGLRVTFDRPVAKTLTLSFKNIKKLSLAYLSTADKILIEYVLHLEVNDTKCTLTDGSVLH